MEMTPKFKLQLQYKARKLKKAQFDIYSSDMLMANEFVEIFEKIGITTVEQDVRFLKFYHSQQKNPNTQTVSVTDLLETYGITDHLEKIIDQVTDQLSEKHLKVNKCMAASQYSFHDMIRLFTRVDLDLQNYKDIVLKRDDSDFPDLVTKTEVDPKDYETVYKSLFDIYTVLRNERANLTKQDIQTLFGIPYMNVMYEEEADENKESLKKPKKKEEEPKKSTRRKKEYDRKEINKTVQNFVSYSKKDDLRMQRVSRLNETFITVDQFKQTLKEMKYPINNEEKFEMLVLAFKEPKSDTKS